MRANLGMMLARDYTPYHLLDLLKSKDCKLNKVYSPHPPPPVISFSEKKMKLLGNFEIKDAKQCILTLFETLFWKLELRRNF